MKAKKFIKWTLIVILVLATIFVTCFLFFKYVIKNDDVKTSSITAYMDTEKKEDFELGIATISTGLNASSDNRFNLLITTNDTINDMLDTLAGYYLVDNGNVTSNAVANSISKLSSKQDKLNDMIEEYNTKLTSSYFDKFKGANDLYVEFCDYLMESANLVLGLKDSLNSVNVDVTKELKFSIFDLYARVVNQDLKETELVSTIRAVKNSENLNFINTHVEVKYSLVNNVNNFSNSAVDFVKNYNACDKNVFAENLKSNCSSSLHDGESANEKAIYSFRTIFGV